MPKKSQAKANYTPANHSLDYNDEKTKPNIRLVQAMSGRPQFTRKRIEVSGPTDSPRPASIGRWIPYAFGVLMALGFAQLQVQAPRSKATKATAVKEFQSQNNYVSPLLETLRAASGK